MFPKVTHCVSHAHRATEQMMTLPELEGRSGYWDAQHRHLRTVRYVRERRPELLSKRFFLLVGERQLHCTHVFSQLSLEKAMEHFD